MFQRILFFAAVLLAASSQPCFATDSPSLLTKIAAVTVYADRAQVTREAAIDVPKQPTKFVIAKLPGWIDAGSVRVALDPPSAGRILDVAVNTAY